MKKYLPFIILGVGIVIMIIVGFLILKNKPSSEIENDEDVSLLELDIKQMPFVSLTPDLEGHYLKLKIDNINISGAKTLEYNLLYQTKDNITQGVPGTIELTGNSYETDLLLGSESSGKFRYDEGVKSGSISLSFRSDQKKLITKISSDFVMGELPGKLSISDSNFNVEYSGNTNAIVVLMNTMGLPSAFEDNNIKGSFGIFSSVVIKSGIEIESDNPTYYWDNGDWININDLESIPLGVFVTTS